MFLKLLSAFTVASVCSGFVQGTSLPASFVTPERSLTVLLEILQISGIVTVSPASTASLITLVYASIICVKSFFVT